MAFAFDNICSFKIEFLSHVVARVLVYKTYLNSCHEGEMIQVFFYF